MAIADCSTVLSITVHTPDGILKPTFLGPAPVCLTQQGQGGVQRPTFLTRARRRCWAPCPASSRTDVF